MNATTTEGKRVNMTFQIADVTKPLGSAKAMLEAGNKVVFEKGNSYIMDRSGKIKTRIEERNGASGFGTVIK